MTTDPLSREHAQLNLMNPIAVCDVQQRDENRDVESTKRIKQSLRQRTRLLVIINSSSAGAHHRTKSHPNLSPSEQRAPNMFSKTKIITLVVVSTAALLAPNNVQAKLNTTSTSYATATAKTSARTNQSALSNRTAAPKEVYAGDVEPETPVLLVATAPLDQTPPVQYQPDPQAPQYPPVEELLLAQPVPEMAPVPVAILVADAPIEPPQWSQLAAAPQNLPAMSVQGMQPQPAQPQVVAPPQGVPALPAQGPAVLPSPASGGQQPAGLTIGDIFGVTDHWRTY